MSAKTHQHIALLDIGQSQPQVDSDFASLGRYIPTFAPLDAYTLDQLTDDFLPQHDSDAISATTAAGTRIQISRAKLEPELQGAVRKAEDAGVTDLIVTCTGEFALESSALRIVMPGRVLQSRTQGVSWEAGDRVAVLVPIDEQQALLTKRWRDRLPKGTAVKTMTISPLSEAEDFAQLGERLKDDGYRAVIMDCFGYSIDQTDAVRRGGLEVWAAKQETIMTLQRGP